MSVAFFRSVAVGAAIIVLIAGPASAHHSFAMFDRGPGKELSLSGTVKEFDLSNPHGWIRVYAQEGQGGLWSFEMASVAQLKAYGWSNDAIKPGDKVVVSYYPLRFGSNGGEFISVTLAGGKVLKGLAEGDRGFPTSR